MNLSEQIQREIDSSEYDRLIDDGRITYATIHRNDDGEFEYSLFTKENKIQQLVFSANVQSSIEDLFEEFRPKYVLQRSRFKHIDVIDVCHWIPVIDYACVGVNIHIVIQEDVFNQFGQNVAAEYDKFSVDQIESIDGRHPIGFGPSSNPDGTVVYEVDSEEDDVFGTGKNHIHLFGEPIVKDISSKLLSKYADGIQMTGCVKARCTKFNTSRDESSCVISLVHDTKSILDDGEDDVVD